MQRRIEELELELNSLKMLVSTPKDEKLSMVKGNAERHDYIKCNLSNIEIERYSRQMILPEVGVKGEWKNYKILKLLNHTFINKWTKLFNLNTLID